jgi:hypothetical protein
MTVEHQPTGHDPLEPAQGTVTEMSFGTAVRKAVDDLFTCEAIAAKLQEIPANDAVPALLESWKQGLTSHLQTHAQTTVENVVANLTLLQSGESEAFSEVERLEWERIEQWYIAFPVASICREDLKGILPEPVIATLSDEVMSQIAHTLWQRFYDNQSYWDNLASATRTVLGQTQQQPFPTPSAKEQP